MSKILLNTIEEAIESIKRGEIIIVVTTKTEKTRGTL